MDDPSATEAPETPDTPTSEGTPAEASAEATPEASEEKAIDWQSRYDNLRPQWDRTKQQLTEVEPYLPLIQSLQSDPVATIRALQEQYGDELGQEYDDDDEFEDPGERALRILQEQQETAQQTADRERREQMEEQYVGAGIDDLAKRDNVNLSDDAQTLIYALSTHEAMRGDDGRPDVEAAYDALRAFEKEVRDNYVASKKAPRIPSGRAGEKSPDLSNDEERVRYMAELVEAGMQD